MHPELEQIVATTVRVLREHAGEVERARVLSVAQSRLNSEDAVEREVVRLLVQALVH